MQDPRPQVKNLDEPDEVLTVDLAVVDTVQLGDLTIGRMVLQPGWRWSKHVRPTAGTDSCQVHHVGIAQSGRIAVRHDDCTEAEIGPGQAYEIAPGHDAWVVGDESFVGYEFETRAAEEFAKA